MDLNFLGGLGKSKGSNTLVWLIIIAIAFTALRRRSGGMGLGGFNLSSLLGGNRAGSFGTYEAPENGRSRHRISNYGQNRR